MEGEPSQVVDLEEILISESKQNMSFRTVFWQDRVSVGDEPSEKWFPLLWVVHLMHLEHVDVTVDSLIMLIKYTVETNDAAILKRPNMLSMIVQRVVGSTNFITAMVNAVEVRHLVTGPSYMPEHSYMDLLMKQLYPPVPEAPCVAKPTSFYRNVIQQVTLYLLTELHTDFVIQAAHPDFPLVTPRPDFTTANGTRLYSLMEGLVVLHRSTMSTRGTKYPFTKTHTVAWLVKITDLLVKVRFAYIDTVHEGSEPEHVPRFESPDNQATLLMLSIAFGDTQLVYNILRLITREQWGATGRDGLTVQQLLDRVEDEEWAAKVNQLISKFGEVGVAQPSAADAR